MEAVALREFIEKCPPTLDPSCPHSVESQVGLTCQEECKVHLASISSDPFDAGQVAASDQGQPGSNWHTISLIRFVSEQAPSNRFLSAPPDRFALPMSKFKRQVYLTAALAELSVRGIDVDRLLRHAIGPEIVRGIVTAACVGYTDLRLGTDPPALVTFLAQALESDIGELPLGTGGSEIFRAAINRARTNGFEAKLFGWLKSATLQQIALWEVPSHDQQWNDLADAAISEDAEMLWLLDRTTNTFVSDWRTTSLQFEIQLICEDLVPTLPAQLLDHRHCSLADCAGELARRADDLDEALMHMHNNIVGVQRRATELLLRGEPALAAALFEETLVSAPRSSEQVLQNNLAFCLIPDEPERASEVLRKAVGAGFTRAVAAYNLAVAQYTLGNLSEARVLVDLALGRDDEPALLWIPTDGGLELCEATTSEAALALRERLESGR